MSDDEIEIGRAEIKTLPRRDRPLWMDKMAAVGAPVFVLGGIITYASIQRVRSDACCAGEAEPFVVLGVVVLVVGLEMMLVWVLRLGEYRTPKQVIAGIIGWPLLIGGVIYGAAGIVLFGTVDPDDILGGLVQVFLILAFILPAFLATLVGSSLVLAARGRPRR